jgi:hypothetical protein
MCPLAHRSCVVPWLLPESRKTVRRIMVSLREMARADAERVPPAWLLEAEFFEACSEHPDANRAAAGATCSAPSARDVRSATPAS